MGFCRTPFEKGLAKSNGKGVFTVKKRVLPVFLALVIALGMLPMTVLADDEQEEGKYEGYTLAEWVGDAKTYGEAILEGYDETTGKITLEDKTIPQTVSQLKNAALNVLGAQAAWDSIVTDENSATNDQKTMKATLDALVEGFAGIENLDMSEMGLTDVNFLEVFTGLKTLDISDNTNVTDLNALKFCTELEKLDASNCGLENVEDQSGQATNGITGLEFCTKLKTLDLSGNANLTDLNALEFCTGLEVLDASDCGLVVADKDGEPVNGITGLAFCTNLKSLNLSGNSDLDDINALAGVKGGNTPLAKLETLTLDSTAVTTLAPLAGCTSLSSLSAKSLELTDIGPAELLAGLDDLTLTGTKLMIADDDSNRDALVNAAKIIAAGNPDSGLIVTDHTGDTTYYLITVTQPTGGTITVSKSSASADEEITVTAVPTSGYEGGTITVTKANGGTVTVTGGKFTMPAENVTVSASFTAVAPVDPVVPTSDIPTLEYTYRTDLTGDDLTKYFGGKLEITNNSGAQKTYIVAISDRRTVDNKDLSITYMMVLANGASDSLSCQNMFQVQVLEVPMGTNVNTVGDLAGEQIIERVEWTPVINFAD